MQIYKGSMKDERGKYKKANPSWYSYPYYSAFRKTISKEEMEKKIKPSIWNRGAGRKTMFTKQQKDYILHNYALGYSQWTIASLMWCSGTTISYIINPPL